MHDSPAENRSAVRRSLSIRGPFLLLALLAVGCRPGGPGPETSFDEFARHLESSVPAWMDAYGIPGASVALIVDGRTAWAGAFGYADPRVDRTMELDAVYRVESLSKPVTAWGVLRLVDDGLVELDDPVEDHLSEVRLPSSGFDTRQVTIRRLLSGTAGLPLGTLGMEYAPGEPMPSLEEVLQQEARLVAPPGSGFVYSNPGFNLLELLVQDVTGRDFGAYMEERILRPLGMVDAGYGWNASLAGRIPVGHDLAGRTVEPYTYPERGAGGLVATVEDMARFMAAGMPGSSGGGGGVLEPASVRQLHTVEATGLGIFGFVADGYGLGHFVEELPGGVPAVFHGGQGHGWMTHMHGFPDSGDGIVILTNSQRSWPFMARLLGDWTRWRGLPRVGMTRITPVTRLLGAFIVVLLAGSAWQMLRLARELRAGRRRPSPLLSGPRFLRAVQLGVAGALAGLVVWAAQAEYFFLASVVPHLMGGLGTALLLVALVLVASALLPRDRPTAR